MDRRSHSRRELGAVLDHRATETQIMLGRVLDGSAKPIGAVATRDEMPPPPRIPGEEFLGPEIDDGGIPRIEGEEFLEPDEEAAAAQ